MASSGKTEKLGLSLWESTDRPEYADFRQDNEKLEQLVGGHLADVNTHVTAEEKNYLKLPYKIMHYQGTGQTSRTAAIFPKEVTYKAVFIMCSDRPPCLLGEDGKINLYWDYWYNSNQYAKATMGMNGVKISGKEFTVYSKPSLSHSDVTYHLNDRDKWYLAIFLPELS